MGSRGNRAEAAHRRGFFRPRRLAEATPIRNAIFFRWIFLHRIHSKPLFLLLRHGSSSADFFPQLRLRLAWKSRQLLDKWHPDESARPVAYSSAPVSEMGRTRPSVPGLSADARVPSRPSASGANAPAGGRESLTRRLKPSEARWLQANPS